MNSKHSVLGLCAVALASLMVTSPAGAASITFTGSATNADGGHALKAQADFAMSGTNLLVTLTNTSTDVADRPSDMLSGLFFNIASNPTMSAVSAFLAGGSVVVNNGGLTGPNAGEVGGEWAYKNSNSWAAPGGANQGISSSGYSNASLFGSANFPGNNLQGPAALDGIEYAIAPTTYAAGSGNGGVSTQGLIQNSVLFTLGNVPVGFDPSTITNVTFQYGTATTEASFPGTPGGGGGGGGSGGQVPEPGTLVLLAAGLPALRSLRKKQGLKPCGM